MAIRLEVSLNPSIPDARGRDTAARARRFLRAPVSSCRTRDVYLVDMPLSPAELARVRRAFADPVTARAAAGRLPPPKFDWLIEVGFRPGVTDNLGHTAREAIADVLDREPGPREGVYTATQYFLLGPKLARADAGRIGRDLLANELIQTCRVFSPAEWAAAPPDTEPPVIRETVEPRARPVDLGGPDEELLRISREGVLSLDLGEMKAIRDYFARPEVRSAREALGLPAAPTDVEVECLAQTWSEHCKHKIFAARIRYVDVDGREEWIDSLFKTFIRGATERVARERDWLVSVFTDNAGIIRFSDRYHLAVKVETHNTPSALDPYGGAITGIVGVNRDLMGAGMGGELVCNTWGYCFASPFHDGPVPEGLMPPRRIRDGVHQGVIDGGNQSGVPWMRGFERFDERFLGKPLVFCGTVGRIPCALQGRPSERKEVAPGDLIVMCGGRIGKDGIHGATFSSEELRKESPAQAVQIGDPITQRRMYEFLIEARDAGLYRAITDNGAGGLSSSVGEMSRLSGGADLDLALAPLKYEGLQPWEILLSEAQERMTLAVPPEHWDTLSALARRRDVEATALGRFTGSGALVVRYGDRVVGRIGLDFLHDGCPRLTLEARWTPPAVPAPARPRAGARTGVLLDLLRSLNVCSKEFKSRRYDAEVKGLSVVKPFVGARADLPADATVMRVEHDRDEGLILADGINPFYSDLDTYAMAASVVDEAVRRVISAGGSLDRIAGLDNFCWPDPVLSEKTPDGPHKLAQLVRANRALYDVTTAYGVPCISGKDSMKNDSVRGGKKISIPPTLLFSTIGVLDDVRRAVTPDFKQAGDVIYAVGLTRDELGASEYHRLLAARQGRPGAIGGAPPGLDAALATRLYRAIGEAAQAGLLRSSHTPTLGGLAVALALAAMGGNLGADADLAAAPGAAGLDDDALLFSESNSRFVVTCAPERAGELEALFRDLPCARAGTVTAEARLRLRIGSRRKADVSIDRIRRAFKETLDGF
ncbi:MAG TPA: AIR synthase-related protein [Kiritimatiellia bacterium]|nr:AIR synthase-related protein [Kiritimatiellia bacterium]HRZ12876.1 AIR synthase-related protein [Kiritimatiellia bacterium]HSA18172.1 AIR synthase-related protein [Kiritimatiellia bacterium]